MYGQDDAIQAICQRSALRDLAQAQGLQWQLLFSTFLLGIAKNKLLQHRGRQDPEPSPPVVEDDDMLDTLQSNEPPPELQVLEQEKMNVCRTVLITSQRTPAHRCSRPPSFRQQNRRDRTETGA